MLVPSPATDNRTLELQVSSALLSNLRLRDPRRLPSKGQHRLTRHILIHVECRDSTRSFQGSFRESLVVGICQQLCAHIGSVGFVYP